MTEQTVTEQTVSFLGLSWTTANVVATVAVIAALISATLAFSGVIWTQRRSDARARQDRKDRRDEEVVKEAWRRVSEKRQRLAAEFETVLRGANTLAGLVGPIQWTPDNMRPPDEVQRIRQLVTDLYGELQIADVRLRLEGVPDVARQMHDLAVHFQRFRTALGFLGDPAISGGGVNFFDQLNDEATVIAAGRDAFEQLLPQVLEAVLPMNPRPMGLEG